MQHVPALGIKRASRPRLNLLATLKRVIFGLTVQVVTVHLKIRHNGLFSNTCDTVLLNVIFNTLIKMKYILLKTRFSLFRRCSRI